MASTRSILKSAFNHFLCGSANRDFKVGVGVTSGSAGGASSRLTGSCPGVSVRSVDSLGVFCVGGGDIVGSGWCSSNVFRG